MAINREPSANLKIYYLQPRVNLKTNLELTANQKTDLEPRLNLKTTLEPRVNLRTSLAFTLAAAG